jgi:hypothetical protein
MVQRFRGRNFIKNTSQIFFNQPAVLYPLSLPAPRHCIAGKVYRRNTWVLD